jgi:1,4-dihydroxy-2-naphthoyl-CoA hydrolase
MLKYPPEYSEKVAWLESNTTPDLIHTLGFEFTSFGFDKVEGQVEVTPKLYQPFGVVHGGVSALLVESVASIGAWLRVPQGDFVVGIEVNVNHLKSVTQGMLLAIGTPLHEGRSTQVWGVELWNNGARSAVGRCTLLVKTHSRPVEQMA